MLTSIALIMIFGLALSEIFKKLMLPGLIGMLITGIVLGPHVLNLLDDSILSVSGDLREAALVIILLRAGLALDPGELKMAGRPAALLCFVPACFEIAGMVLIAPGLLNISVLDAAITGAVVGAVSPAVIVPKMLFLMENKYGTNKSIPQMIMAGASVDDVFVIVLFTAFTGIAQGDKVSPFSLFKIPVSIISGLAAGISAGLIISLFFKKAHVRDSVKAILILSVAFLFVALENYTENIFPFSGLLAVMSMGAALKRKRGEAAKRLSGKFSKLWVAAEVMLFVLVGAAVDIKYAASAGAMAVAAIFGALIFRMAGVGVCLTKTKLNKRERLFCSAAYTPKATVQAAIGSVPLAMGLSCGNIVLTVAVLAILITAPLGAFGIDFLYKRCLEKEN